MSVSGVVVVEEKIQCGYSSPFIAIINSRFPGFSGKENNSLMVKQNVIYYLDLFRDKLNVFLNASIQIFQHTHTNI